MVETSLPGWGLGYLGKKGYVDVTLVRIPLGYIQDNFLKFLAKLQKSKIGGTARLSARVIPRASLPFTQTGSSKFDSVQFIDSHAVDYVKKEDRV